MPTKAELLLKANDLPVRPGVYIMRDRSGKVIYVGKSAKLKNRVSQYFQNSEKDVKTTKMVASVFDFDYILCDTEMEALSLENSLIKQYQALFGLDNVELEITDDALEMIAEKAIERKSGARALRSIFENCLMDAMFKVPDDNTIEKVILDKNAVETGVCQYVHGQARQRYSDNSFN